MSEGLKKAEADAERAPQDEATLLARRRLLKRGFVAPAVLASFVLSQGALAQQQTSCGPQRCDPWINECNPRWSCGPAKKP